MPSLLQRASFAAKALTGIFSDQRFTRAIELLAGFTPKSTPPKRGTREFLLAYGEMPWLFAIANRVATSVSAIQWKAMAHQKTVNGRKTFVKNRILQYAPMKQRAQLVEKLTKQGELVEIEENPLLDIFESTNPVHTSMSMRMLSQLHLDLVGETFLMKERGMMGQPSRLWVIPPHWIHRLPSADKPTFELRHLALVQDIPDTEMLYFSHPNPEDPYGRGLGISQALSDELETDEYSAKHTKQFFWNQARPDLLIYPKGQTETGSRIFWNKKQVRELEMDWRSKVQGFMKSWAPYFVPQELGVHEFSQNFRNLQLVPLREFERNTCLQVWGVPPEIMGIIENSNRATIDSSFYLFCMLAIIPRLEFLRTSFQEKLVPEFDERIILMYDSPMDDDKEFQLKVAQIAPWMLTQNEWRNLGGFEEAKTGGDLHTVPSNTTFTDDLERYQEEADERREELRESLLQNNNNHSSTEEDGKDLESYYSKRLNIERLSDTELWTLDSLLAKR